MCKSLEGSKEEKTPRNLESSGMTSYFSHGRPMFKFR